MGLPDLSVDRPVTITMLIMIIVVVGFFALYNLGLELFPDLTYPVISVMTTYEGASPEDVEQMITRPIEENIATISNVKSVKSISYEGVSTVMTEFEWGTNLDFAAQDIRDRIAMISGYLPEGIDDPLVLKFDISMMPILVLAATGMDDTEQMRTILDDVFADRLKRVGGVANVSIMGGEEAEMQILLDPVRLEVLGVNPNTIVQAIYAQNINQPAGYVNYRQNEYLIRTKGEFQFIEDIENVMVGMNVKGRPIYVKDVGEVIRGHKFHRSVDRVNGKNGVMIMVMKESGANTVKVSNKVRKEMEKVKSQLPEGVEIVTMFDQGDFISKIAQRTGGNAVAGALLAVVMIFIFLRSSRPTLAISIAIPFSVVATFIAIWLAGFSLNIITMAGLALGVGMLVDNAIVVIESIHRHIEMGRDRFTAAKEGAKEVGMAITASTLTTVAVFFPLLFASGIAGKLSRGMALTVTFALFSSLFVALSLIPMIASQIFDKKKIANFGETGWFDPVRRAYLRILDICLKHRPTTLIVTLSTFVVALLLIPLVGTEFMPRSDPPVVSAELELPVGVSIDVTERVADNLFRTIKDESDVILYGYSAGVSAANEMDIATGQASASVNRANMYMGLKPKNEREHSSQEIGEMMRKNLPDLPGYNLIIEDAGMNMGSTNSFDVQIYGSELDELSRIAALVEKEIKDINGIKDVNVSLKRGKPEFDINVNRGKAAYLGLTTGEVAQLIRTYTIGTLAGRYRELGDEMDIRVKLPEKHRKTTSQIGMLPIFTRLGTTIPLLQIADIDHAVGPISIERDEQKRKVSVTANLSGRSLGAASKDVNAMLEGLMEKGAFPTGYSYKVGGQYEDMRSSLEQLIIALIAAILLVYMVMAAQFESFVLPFVIMFTVPLSLIGVILAMLVSGSTISIVSFFGFIILTGIVVNNGIVLIDYMNQQRKTGIDTGTAIRKGGIVRLRPVLITALTTIFGMLPMAMSTSEGAEFRAPVAIGIIGGLITSTILTLVVIPIVYSFVTKYKFTAGSFRSFDEIYMEGDVE